MNTDKLKYESQSSLSGDVRHVVRGLLMGGADIIPGVSGGTVALILGIYERLVGAISRVDRVFFGFLAKRAWADAARHIDLRFLVALGIGVLTGVAVLAKLMHYLLEHQRVYTLALFFGLILASSFIVAKTIRATNVQKFVGYCTLGIVAAIFAYWLVGLDAISPSDSLSYTFLSGAVAICAMILPGISGAYILLLLGMYHSVTGLLHRFTDLAPKPGDFAQLVVFVSGCLLGLLLFSKFLRWILARHHNATMAILCGFMLGSLRKIWPFQIDTTPDVEKFKLKIFENIQPETWDMQVTVCLVIAVVAAVAVLAFERATRRETVL